MQELNSKLNSHEMPSINIYILILLSIGTYSTKYSNIYNSSFVTVIGTECTTRMYHVLSVLVNAGTAAEII